VRRISCVRLQRLQEWGKILELSNEPNNGRLVMALRHQRIAAMHDVLVVACDVVDDRSAPAMKQFEGRPEHAFDETKLQYDVARSIDACHLCLRDTRENAIYAFYRVRR
jgi:hypothetical protein